ncbi:hypothetical protein NPIL_62141, partial [Nephila pilipes]
KEGKEDKSEGGEEGKEEGGEEKKEGGEEGEKKEGEKSGATSLITSSGLSTALSLVIASLIFSFP